MPLLCCDCNRQTKKNLEDENKANKFLCMLASLSDEN